MQLIVTLLLLEAYGPTMIEILLTARGVVSVCGMSSFSRTDYSAAEACSESEWVIFVFLDRRTLAFVRVCVFLYGVCMIVSITVCMCSLNHLFAQ